MPSNFAKATLIVEGGERIECWLNPTTLHTSRSARYGCKRAIGRSVASLSYLGGNAESLAVALVLHAEDRRTGNDVARAIRTLHSLLEPTIPVAGRDQGRPRTIRLSWGEYLSFDAVCESVDVTVELFDADGAPLRALVNIKLIQFGPDPGQSWGESQNPTTRELARRRLHTIVHGDTLQSLAYAHLGDPTRWREIAEANEIDDPLNLRPGTEIAIPLAAA